MSLGNILVADDDGAIRTVLNQALSRAGYSVRLTSNAATLWRWVSEGEGDLVITDVVMPDENAFDLLPRLKRVRPELPVIVMSAQNTFMTAIRASERGAYDYLPKPFDLRELITIVGRALSEPKAQREAAPAVEAVETMPLIGRSAAMQEIYRVLARLMQTDLTVMVAGSGRFTTDFLEAGGGRWIGKEGAEGVYAVGLAPAAGARQAVGVAFKIEDGSARPRDAVTLEVLARLGRLPEAARRTLAAYAEPVVHNARGANVGRIEADAPIARTAPSRRKQKK